MSVLWGIADLAFVRVLWEQSGAETGRLPNECGISRHAVEFWIITLIMVGTYLLIADSGQLSREAIFSALLFPAALAMVELARVPLTIAVRTQPAWHIKRGIQ